MLYIVIKKTVHVVLQTNSLLGLTAICDSLLVQNCRLWLHEHSSYSYSETKHKKSEGDCRERILVLIMQLRVLFRYAFVVGGIVHSP